MGIYYQTVLSEHEPSGDIKGVLVKGAEKRNTKGGRATSKKRCVYYWKEDIDNQSSKPLYVGDVWPYIYAESDDCEIAFHESVPKDSRLREDGFVSLNDDNLLLIGGLPVYQYPDDGDLECLCNHPPYWTSLYEDGNGAAFNVKL